VTKNIATEYFGEEIGYIVCEGNHFYYKDSAGDHDGQSGAANCGLYALKRLLFVLGRKDIVAENLWYEYTDSQLREKIAKMVRAEYAREVVRPTTLISARHLRKLMIDINIPSWYCDFYDRKGKKSLQAAFASFYSLIPEEQVTDKAEIEAMLEALEKQAKVGLAKAKEWMAKVIKKAGEAEKAGNDKEKAVEQEMREFNAALGDVKQAQEVVEAIYDEMYQDVFADYADVPPDLWERVDALRPITAAAFENATIAYEEIGQVLAGFRIEE
jgi:hypothetical protein